jgi:hypothetical protein
MATLVAAVEPDDGVRLVPQYITEVSACVGRLIAITNNTLSVKNDKGGCFVHTNAQTTFWMGETYHDASALKLRDEVAAGVTVSYPGRVQTAEHVEANVAKVEGMVILAQSDRIVVKDFRFARKGDSYARCRHAHRTRRRMAGKRCRGNGHRTRLGSQHHSRLKNLGGEIVLALAKDPCGTGNRPATTFTPSACSVTIPRFRLSRLPLSSGILLPCRHRRVTGELAVHRVGETARREPMERFLEDGAESFPPSDLAEGCGLRRQGGGQGG